MTEKELSQYYYLKEEQKDIENELAELGYGVGSPILTDEPKGTNHSSNLTERLSFKRIELINLLIENKISALEEYIKIQEYISSVEDSEIRIIMRKRFLRLKSWETIGRELHSDRTTVSKKIRRYLEKVSHNSH